MPVGSGWLTPLELAERLRPIPVESPAGAVSFACLTSAEEGSMTSFR